MVVCQRAGVVLRLTPRLDPFYCNASNPCFLPCLLLCCANAPTPQTYPHNPAGLFVDVEHGTELLMLAVRRDVGDLSLAHRVYDSMRGTLR